MPKEKEEKEVTYDFNNFKGDALERPRDKAWSNWASFKQVGDKVGGYIRDVFFRPATGVFSDQRGITLEQIDGTLINVGIKEIDFILAKTDGLRLGDPLTVVFDEEKPSATKGGYATKIYGFYGKNLPENEGNKTVKELEAEDRAKGGTMTSTDSDTETDSGADIPF